MTKSATILEMRKIEQSMRKSDSIITPIKNDELLQSTYIMINIHTLKDASTNRDLRSKNLTNLTRSILADELKHPITINENRLIINGHHRVEVFKRLSNGNPENEYNFIKANVVAGLTEEDVILYNNEDLSWTANDFYDKLDNNWLNQYEEYGFAVTNFKYLLTTEIKERITKETIKYENLPNYKEIENFVHTIYIPIYERAAYNPMAKKYKGKHRFLPDIIHEATFMKKIDFGRLMEKTAKHWAEINNCGSARTTIRKNFAKYYNLGLRDDSKKLLLNEKIEFIKGQ